MWHDPIVEEKHRVQRELAREAGGGVDAYFRLVDRVVEESVRRRGLTLSTADIPVRSPLPSSQRTDAGRRCYPDTGGRTST